MSSGGRTVEQHDLAQLGSELVDVGTFQSVNDRLQRQIDAFDIAEHVVFDVCPHGGRHAKGLLSYGNMHLDEDVNANCAKSDRKNGFSKERPDNWACTRGHWRGP